MMSNNQDSSVAAQQGDKSRRLPPLALYVFACLVIAFSATLFALSVGKPYMGTILYRGLQGWTVQTVDPNGVAFQAGIGPGDRPVEINGQPAQAFLQGYEDSGIVYSRVIGELTVTDVSGRLKSAALHGTPPSERSVTEVIAYLVVSLAFWTTGLYAFYKTPRNVAALLLCLCGLVLGLAFSSQLAAERIFPSAAYIEIVASVIGPWLLFHFFLVLPEERTSLRKSPLVYLVYLPAVITLVLLPLIGVTDGQPNPAFRTFRLSVYGMGFLGSALVAAFNYFRAAAPRTRQQMRIVLVFSLIALIPFVVVGVLPAIWGENALPYGLNIAFFAFIPIGLGHAVVSQKLMDIDVIIRRGVVYGLISLVMAAIMSVAMLVVGAFRATISTSEKILVGLVLGIVAALLFGPAKRAIEFLVDRFFYKDRYDYRQIIQSFSLSLNSVRDFEDIARLIVAAPVDVMNLAGACLFTRGLRGNLRVGAAHGILTDDRRQQTLMARLTPDERDAMLEFPNSASSVEPDLAFFVPLVAEEREVGMLCLSHKVTRQAFSSNDLYLIQGLASVAAIALRSAILVRDVSARDTFISIAAHELNTPLTAVNGNADLLVRSEALAPKEKRWAKRVLDGGLRMSEIVDDLLNVTRIQSGKVVMRLVMMKLDSILSDKLTMAKESSDKHQFCLDVAPDVPEVLVDRDKFGQVVWNLLSNAIKYSPKGGQIVLSARYDPWARRVVVSVADQGMGIGPADKESLFTTFHRIQRPETVSIKGAGLGLYIVKEWTIAMGGEVWLESELDKGSTFYVTVPTACSDGHLPAA